MSEPTSYSERNIDHEVELHRLQELLRTGNAAEPVEDTSKQTIAAGSSNSSVNLSSSSATATEADDPVPSSHSSKPAVSLPRGEFLGSAVLKERRTYFMQNGCNRSTEENGEQKRHSVDVGRLADGTTFREPASSTAATCTTSESTATPVLADTSRRPGDVKLAVPSSRAVKMQRAVEQQMQLLADDLQRTFSAATTLPPASEKQQTSAVHQLELSAGDPAARSAADSQSVTSDYSTMSSVCGGQDHTRRRSRLVSGDLELPAALDVDVEKIADRSATDRRRNRSEVAHSTPRSQSSGNFSLTNSDPVEASPYAASRMEMSQDSIDSAADRSDQLSLSLSSQMSGSQLSVSDDLLRTVGVVDKQSYSPVVVESSGAVDQTSGSIDSSCVTSAAGQVEQFVQPTVAGLMPHDSNATKTDSETDIVLGKQSGDVDPVLSEKQDVSRVQVGSSAAEVLSVNTDLAGREQKTDCTEGTNVSQVKPSTDDRVISVPSSNEQFLQSQLPVYRLVRRHTLGGTGDLAIHVLDRKLESPLSVQSAPLHDEERLSAWQRLKPVVGDQLPNFGMWLATQREVYHVRSSPALLVGVGLSTASRLHSSRLNCQSVV